MRLWILVLPALYLVAAPLFAQLPPAPTGRQADREMRPRIEVEQRNKDLGSVVEGETLAVSWTIRNQGEADLVIERTQSTCGCTVVQLTEKEKVIPPGGSLEFKAEFNSTGRRGEQRKAVGIFTNDPVEPEIKLDFRAMVEPLYDIDPQGLLNLRAVQRGQLGERSLDLYPASGRKTIEILHTRFEGEPPLELEIEPISMPSGTGQRIRLRASQAASLGSMGTALVLRISVDGVERELSIPVRADVVGDLTWTPVVLDATRQTLIPGRMLAPITIRSTAGGGTPMKPSSPGAFAPSNPAAPGSSFEVVDVLCDPPLAPSYESMGVPPRTYFSVYVTVEENAKPGPFATMLKILTNSLDQPLIEIPVYGIITPPLSAEPPMILLRADGTPVGTERLVKLLAAPTAELEVTKVTCDHPGVEAMLDPAAGRRPRNQQFLRVRLTGNPDSGPKKPTVKVVTNIAGYENFEIPLMIDAGSAGR